MWRVCVRKSRGVAYLQTSLTFGAGKTSWSVRNYNKHNLGLGSVQISKKTQAKRKSRVRNGIISKDDLDSTHRFLTVKGTGLVGSEGSTGVVHPDNLSFREDIPDPQSQPTFQRLQHSRSFSINDSVTNSSVDADLVPDSLQYIHCTFQPGNTQTMHENIKNKTAALNQWSQSESSPSESSGNYSFQELSELCLAQNRTSQTVTEKNEVTASAKSSQEFVLSFNTRNKLRKLTENIMGKHKKVLVAENIVDSELKPKKRLQKSKKNKKPLILGLNEVSFLTFSDSDVQSSCIDKSDTLCEESFTKSPGNTSKKDKGIDKRKKNKEKEAEHAEKLKKHTSDQQKKFFNEDLCAYVEACVFIGNPGLAQSKIKFYRYQRKRNQNGSNYVLTDTKVYDALFHAWAKIRAVPQMKELISFMREDGLSLSGQTYCALLECFGCMDIPDIDEIKNVLADIKNGGMSIESLLKECIFVQNQKQSVLNALRVAGYELSLSMAKDEQQYSGPLVNDLNNRLPSHQIVERNPHVGVFSASDLKNKFKRQLSSELCDYVAVDSIEKKVETDEKTLEMRSRLKLLKDDLGISLHSALKKKLDALERAEKEGREIGLTLYPYFRLFDLQEYVDIMLLEFHMIAVSSEYFSPSTNYLARRLGQRVYNKYLIKDKVNNRLTDQIARVYQHYAEDFVSADFPYNNHRQCWQHFTSQHNDGPTIGMPNKKWSPFIIKSIGKQLYDLMMYDVKMDGNILKKSAKKRLVPALFLIYRSYGHITNEELKPHPALFKLYNAANLNMLIFESGDLPMLVPPVPWSAPNVGGHLLNSAKLIRLPPQIEGHYDVVEKIEPKQLYPVFDSLNNLAVCPWMINKPILDLIIEVFNNKGNKHLDIPPPISECPLLPKMSKKMNNQEKSKIIREKLKLKQQKAEMYSLWCNELYRLSIANKFRDEIFFFPHNMDFRGRTYPCPPHFNHLGSDVTRSILLFAKGKPLGENGLDWLKIHLVNLTGFKKRSSNAERLQYANKMLPEILDSADNPMTGKKWWQKSDEPWQTLSCCMEIAKAIRSADPAKYVCSYPVHQDGSCNGLQHYAALGRDQAGAESVNLCPYDNPKDVYSDVAELVELVRVQDAENGVEIAKIVEGFVRRKVIKQTVMTTVYGVTRYGAKYQILRQLRDIPEFPKEFVWPASSYLTEKTFLCLQQMFTATKEIQDWLTMSAHTISNLCQRPVEWITPLGLPVLQPYHKMATMQKFGVSITGAFNTLEKPNSMKQKNGFPPNFIHSLDSTHMMLTSLYCLRAGITFVSVHDCYWTHACDVAIMNRICREQFVSLHSQPILEDLSAYLISTFVKETSSQDEKELQKQNFLEGVLGNIPNRGEFDLTNVLKSTYFFS